MFKTLRSFGWGITLAVAALTLHSCSDEPRQDRLTAGYDAKVAIKWNELLLKLDRIAVGYRPPVAARAFGYIELAAYESVVYGMPEYNTMEKSIPGLFLPPTTIDKNIAYHWPTCMNTAYSTIIQKFYNTADGVVSNQEVFDMLKLEADLDKEALVYLSQAEYNRSKDFGRKVAEAIYAWSLTDKVGAEGFKNLFPSSYVPPVGPGKWKPTPPNFKPAMLPQWGAVRPFIIDVAKTTVANPYDKYGAYKSGRYDSAAHGVLSAVEEAGFEDQWIAQFWSDDIGGMTFTPPGRLIAIANQLIVKQGTNLETAAFLYAKLGIGLCDAGIACWNAKYTWNVERPVTYIHEVLGRTDWETGLNFYNYPNKAAGITPPFPAYPSGHSTFGAVGGEIFASIYGNNLTFSDNCHIDRKEFIGNPRPFGSFTAMAREDANSRVPLGVHWQMDCDEGVILGNNIAAQVNALPWKK
jgi:membrane-associated phospholipid phosphatase